MISLSARITVSKIAGSRSLARKSARFLERARIWLSATCAPTIALSVRKYSLEGRKPAASRYGTIVELKKIGSVSGRTIL
ncbi:hypothetical protein HYR54_07680 [Candidatus Acetothermia bacterium]|nr:hypothetical protein [Candidatus Acetothermia bacterium]